MIQYVIQLILMRKWVSTKVCLTNLATLLFFLNFYFLICFFFLPFLEVDSSPNRIKSNKSGVERMLEFGRDLFQMSQRLEKENGTNEKNQKMLEVSILVMSEKNNRTFI